MVDALPPSCQFNRSTFKIQSLGLPANAHKKPTRFPAIAQSQIIPFYCPVPNQTATTTTMSIIPSFFGGRRSNVFDPVSLDVWNPFFNTPSLFPSAASDFARDTSQFASTHIDWKETTEAHVFKADLPGLKKEEVKVEVEDGRVLQISGERSRDKEEKSDTWHRVERSSGKFLRRFRLPENAKVEGVKAAMENGLLTVTVPKEEVKKADVKAIKIN